MHFASDAAAVTWIAAVASCAGILAAAAMLRFAPYRPQSSSLIIAVAIAGLTAGILWPVALTFPGGGGVWWAMLVALSLVSLGFAFLFPDAAGFSDLVRLYRWPATLRAVIAVSGATLLLLLLWPAVAIFPTTAPPPPVQRAGPSARTPPETPIGGSIDASARQSKALERLADAQEALARRSTADRGGPKTCPTCCCGDRSAGTPAPRDDDYPWRWRYLWGYLLFGAGLFFWFWARDSRFAWPFPWPAASSEKPVAPSDTAIPFDRQG